jgi:shikimate 5-dehydrogenase
VSAQPPQFPEAYAGVPGGLALQPVGVCTVWFVGVSTAGSLVHRAMPWWSPLLGGDVTVTGRDLPLDAPTGAFRSLLDGLARDDDARGAVVTSHKVALHRAASDLFAGLDDLAVACGEVNAVRRTPSGLLGFARDPVSLGRVVDRIWPAGTGDEVVCLGAGGTAVALGRHLSARPQATRLVFTDRRPEAVAHLRARLGAGIATRVGPGPWDELVANARPGALVVNATGMGKDRPGAPLSPSARFPAGAVVWELNYRGDLPLLDQARAQDVAAHDGWSLFCQGWAAALAAVLDLDDAGLGDRFEEAAAPLRPRT